MVDIEKVSIHAVRRTVELDLRRIDFPTDALNQRNREDRNGSRKIEVSTHTPMMVPMRMRPPRTEEQILTSEPVRDRWERRTEWPLTIVAAFFLIAYATPIIYPNLPQLGHTLAHAFLWVAWLAFFIDYATRIYLSPDKMAFIRANIFGLTVVAVPALKPLRLLLLITVLRTLNRHAHGTFRGKVMVYVTGSVGLIVFVGALAALEAERHHPDANILTFTDAIWWAVATVTTVGYGDRYPVSGTGRLIATGLMFAGIALLGVITASFAAWMIERVQEIEEESEAATRRDISALTHQVQALRTDLAQRVEHPCSCAPETPAPNPSSHPAPHI